MKSWESRVLSFFIYSTFILPSALAETGSAGQTYDINQIPILGLPLWVGAVLKIGLCASGLALALIVFQRKRAAGKIPNIMIFMPAATLFLWFIPGGNLASFQLFVPLFHGLQYLLIAWMMQLKEKMDVSGASPSRRFVIHESVNWSVGNIAMGIVLFYVFPKIAALLGYSHILFYTLVIAAVQIHHFFVDGVIWKLRNQRVSSPLKVNIRELYGGNIA